MRDYEFTPEFTKSPPIVAACTAIIMLVIAAIIVTIWPCRCPPIQEYIMTDGTPCLILQNGTAICNWKQEGGKHD